MVAAQWGYTEITKILLDKGAKVNAKNNYGETALILAKKKGYTTITELLKQYGAKE
jgi:ankyrin repeat protein